MERKSDKQLTELCSNDVKVIFLSFQITSHLVEKFKKK